MLYCNAIKICKLPQIFSLGFPSMILTTVLPPDPTRSPVAAPDPRNDGAFDHSISSITSFLEVGPLEIVLTHMTC